MYNKNLKIELVNDKENPVLLSVPLRLNYQGYLTDNSGTPINDTLTMVFRIYDPQTGGNELWSSGNQSIIVTNGVFHYILSNVPLNIFLSGQPRYLELQVEGEVLSPRTEITSAPWSYTATISDSSLGSARIGGQTLNDLDNRYINTGETASGDLSGNYPSPTVAKIQGRPVSNVLPQINQVLKWDGSQWTPSTDLTGESYWTLTGTNLYPNNIDWNVGIGTTSPQYKLYVEGSTDFY